jgi:two-component system sensor histidine kinase/response regulator
MNTNRTKILYVDDEESNLVAFKAIFRRKYDIYTSNNPTHALEVLTENPDIKVIISDQRMKGATGVDFFQTVLKKYPDTIRIILTGFSDEDAIKDAINKAGVFRFLSKPWDEVDLTKTIENGIEIYDVRQEIIEKNKELEKAYGELNKFVYSASHDMRAPLVSIISLLELYNKDDTIVKDTVYIPLIEKSVMMLDDFVKNIVAYYQNEEKEKSIGELNMEALVDECLNSLSHYQDLSNITIKKYINCPQKVVNDVFRVRVVLNNIISNAIKYQRSDEPNKYISIEASNENDGLKLVITDNGIGVDKEELKDLFEMFYRATNQNSGSGIGLHIVKEAVKKLQGDIQVDSLKGQGTTFEIQIPNLESHAHSTH